MFIYISLLYLFCSSLLLFLVLSVHLFFIKFVVGMSFGMFRMNYLDLHTLIHMKIIVVGLPIVFGCIINELMVKTIVSIYFRFCLACSM